MNALTLFLTVFCFSSALSWAQSPALSGIAHVAFRVNDLQASREFYRTLGFEQAFEFHDAGKSAVAFIKLNDRQFIELYERTADSQPIGLLHMCFEATDIEALHREYVKRELKPTAVNKARAGNLLFAIHDPEGQLLEYTQYLPGSLHSEDRGKHLGERRVSQHLLAARTAVRDLAAERAFYTGKLAFEDPGPGGAARLRLPGNSGEEVELEATAAETKPHMVFAVTEIRRAADDLRGRRFAVRMGPAAVSITDPDGTVIIFTSPTDGVAK